LELKYIVQEKDQDRTVKSILKNELGLSETAIRKLKRNNMIYVNSVPEYVIRRVQPGDVIEVNLNFDEANEDVIPEYMDIDIIYEDDYIIALNKQPGVVVHPAAKHRSGTLANALMYYLKSKGINIKIHPVNRLDRETSGVIIFAKNSHIQNLIVRQMKSNTFVKEYRAIVQGIMEQEEGTINLPIARKPDSIMLRHISETGQPAVTHYKVLEYLNNATFVKFILETGRTHQIRVHCHALGHPIIGDSLYTGDLYQSPENRLIDRQALHSFRASFIHPITDKPLDITAPLPQDMQQVIELLRKK